MDMPMYFHFSVMATVLFKGWMTMTPIAMVGSCFVVGLMGFLYEGLKSFREYLYSKNGGSSSVNLVSGAEPSPTWAQAIMQPNHLIQTGLYGVQGILGYMLMLVFMTYNLWLCFAVIFGTMLGFLVFGWRKNLLFEATTDHCS